MLKIVLIIVAVIVLVLLAVGVFFVVSIGPRNIIGMLRYDQRKEGPLHVGDAAPDIAMVALDGSSEVHLKDHLGARPLVIVFGSYT